MKIQSKVTHTKSFLVICVAVVFIGAGCGRKPTLTLKQAFKKDFYVGATLNREQIAGKEPRAIAVVEKHFSSITSENVLKWNNVHPEPDRYDFEAADRFVALGEKNDMFIVGHTLIWRYQTPPWVFQDESGNQVDRETLLERMKEHIFTVVGRYKGRIDGWDVVNEAISDDGQLRRDKWLEIIGEDYIAKAFEYAHQADPNAELYYNDFNMYKTGQVKGVVRLVKNLKENGLRIDGIGIQGHWGLDFPLNEELEAAVSELSQLDVNLMVTELDLTVLPAALGYRGADISKNFEAQKEINPYTDGLPDDVQQKLADRYAELFRFFRKHCDKFSRITFWGVHDGQSWRNKWPVRGRTDYPLLFDRQYKPKPAFYAVVKTKTSPDKQRDSVVSDLFSAVLESGRFVADTVFLAADTVFSAADTLFSVLAPVKTFQNPVVPGFYPDPSICRVGDDYYTVHSTFEYFPGVPVMHSKDLVHWRLIGYCLTRKSQLNLDGVRASGGIYAPTIRYHDGIFYMITTCVDCGGNFYVTAENPAGPWSEPIWINDGGGIDPSLLFDDDGTVYYHRQQGGRHGCTAQAAINIGTGELEGPLKEIWRGTGGIWPEGPHLYKINDKYYLMISEGGTSYGHMVTVARSDSPWGPFESNPNNPILTHRELDGNPIRAVGHADLVETPDGWWLVCLAIRPKGGYYHHIGRETFLAPIVFDSNDWPVVNETGTIDLVMPAPKLPQHIWPKPPARDNFDKKTLALQWNYVRNPEEDNYSLTERPGFLCLHGSAVTLNDQDSPTFVGRRQTDFNCVASTLLEFNPENENEEAGLVVRQNDKHHYEIGVTVRKGKRQVLFRKVLKGKTIDPVRYGDVPAGPVILTVRATPLSYEFSCQSVDGSRQVLGTAATKDLSVEAIGFEDGMCFTGAYFGMYATGNGGKCTELADFNWFEYLATEK